MNPSPITYAASLPLVSREVENEPAVLALPLALLDAEREPVAVAASY